MMIKIFTKDGNGKVSLTPEELRGLLDEAYWEGYKANNNTITYTTPGWTPYIWNGSSITLNTTTCGTETISTAYINAEES